MKSSFVVFIIFFGHEGVFSKPQYGTGQSNMNYYNPWFSYNPNSQIYSYPQYQPSSQNSSPFSAYPQYPPSHQQISYSQNPQYSLWQQPQQQQDSYQRHLGSLNLPQVGVSSANNFIQRFPKLPRKVFIGSGGLPLQPEYLWRDGNIPKTTYTKAPRRSISKTIKEMTTTPRMTTTRWTWTTPKITTERITTATPISTTTEEEEDDEDSWW